MTNANAPADRPFSSTPPGLDSLLQLFHAELAAVQFPGVDAKVLDAAAARIESAAEELRRCEAEAEAARAQLDAAREDALQKGQRALAYARVFAQDTPELLARLDGVALHGAGGGGRAGDAPVASSSTPGVPAAAPRRRGRPPKSASASSLFGGGAAGPSSSATDEGPASGALPHLLEAAPPGHEASTDATAP